MGNTGPVSRLGGSIKQCLRLLQIPPPSMKLGQSYHRYRGNERV
jgi:hypothetical protein